MTLPVNPVKMIVKLASLRTTTKRLQGCQLISSTRFKKVFSSQYDIFLAGI